MISNIQVKLKPDHVFLCKSVITGNVTWGTGTGTGTGTDSMIEYNKERRFSTSGKPSVCKKVSGNILTLNNVTNRVQGEKNF